MLDRLKAPRGATKKGKRVGRGRSSGNGKTAGRGMKGQMSRSGGKNPFVGFEGGQMPMQRRLPKNGFTNPTQKTYAVVNVGDLGKKFAAGEEVDVDKLRTTRLVRKLHDGVKVLGVGELSHALTVKAHRFSKSAKEKIEAAGGKAEVI